MVTNGAFSDYSCEAVLCFLVCACVCLSAIGRGTASELCSHCQCKLWGTHSLSSPSENPVLSSVPQLSLLWVSHARKTWPSLQLLHQCLTCPSAAFPGRCAGGFGHHGGRFILRLPGEAGWLPGVPLQGGKLRMFERVQYINKPGCPT